MNKIIIDDTYGTITYVESLWSEKKEIIVNGQVLPKINKNVYNLNDNTVVTIKKSFKYGVQLEIGEKIIQVSEPIKIYEWILSIIPFIFIITWGAIPPTVKIFPIVGGLLGGLVGGLAIAINMQFVHKIKNTVLKILAYIGVFVVAVLICYLLALVIISAAK